MTPRRTSCVLFEIYTHKTRKNKTLVSDAESLIFIAQSSEELYHMTFILLLGLILWIIYTIHMYDIVVWVASTTYKPHKKEIYILCRLNHAKILC